MRFQWIYDELIVEKVIQRLNCCSRLLKICLLIFILAEISILTIHNGIDKGRQNVELGKRRFLDSPWPLDGAIDPPRLEDKDH